MISDYLSSLRSLLIGVCAGYLVPWLALYWLIAALSHFDLTLLVNGTALIVLVWFYVFGPIITGYFAAKYCNRVPLYHGVGATFVAVLFLVANGNIVFSWLLVPYMTITLGLGYLGAHRCKFEFA